MFLLYGSDAKYVESMEQYLFEGNVAYPGLADRWLRDIVIRSGDVRARKTSYSMTNGSLVCVPYRDFFVLRGKLSHAYDVMMAGRPQNRTLRMLPFSRFPSLPVEVLNALPPQGLSARIPSVAFYSADCVQSPLESVRIRYDVAFLLEWAHNVAASLTLEKEARARMWRCSSACIEFLERFMSLDDFFVEAVNRFVVPVSFRSLSRQLRRVHEFSSAELTSRQNYSSGVSVAWAVVNPGTGSLIPPSTSSPLPPRMSHRTPCVVSTVATSSSQSHSSPLETVISDVQLRVELVLSPVLPTEALRVNGWRVGDVVELLVAKLGAVEAKERSGAVELRNVKERLVIAETKVTTLLEVTKRSRDRGTSRPAPRRQEAARRSDRTERDEYDDYDRTDARDDYRDDTGYTGGARPYPAEKRRRTDDYVERDEDPYHDYDRDDVPYRGASSR